MVLNINSHSTPLSFRLISGSDIKESWYEEGEIRHSYHMTPSTRLITVTFIEAENTHPDHQTL